MTLHTFKELCVAYGVKRFAIPNAKWCSYSISEVVGLPGFSFAINGPGDAAFSIEHHAVAYENSARIANKFHELVHVIVQPPGLSIDVVCEDLLLLQFERQLARICVEARREWNEILRYQLETQAPNISPDLLGDRSDYQRDPVWRRGFSFARRLDLLDKRNRPTLRPARWTPELLAEFRSWLDDWL